MTQISQKLLRSELCSRVLKDLNPKPRAVKSMAGGTGRINSVAGASTRGGDYPDFSEDVGILADVLDSEDHGSSSSVVACEQETRQKIPSLSTQHLFRVLRTVFTDGLYELVVDVVLYWPRFQVVRECLHYSFSCLHACSKQWAMHDQLHNHITNLLTATMNVLQS